MSALIYIHGFLSSPLSQKAQQVKHWLAEQRPDIDYCCPQLNPYPNEVRQELEQRVESCLPGPVYLMGSSMGGFWATYLSEKYRLPAVLINPAVRPYDFMPAYIGVELKNYHTDDCYQLTDEHTEQLRQADVSEISFPQYLWLMVQKGDETLDYRDAVEKYRACKQLVEDGGDHSFQQFERWIPAAIDFLESDHSNRHGKCSE